MDEAELRWREVECEFERFMFLFEEVLRIPAFPASFSARLRACRQRLREAWEREVELRRCDMAAIFKN